jgi:hypothetical protein
MKGFDISRKRSKHNTVVHLSVSKKSAKKMTPFSYLCQLIYN